MSKNISLALLLAVALISACVSEEIENKVPQLKVDLSLSEIPPVNGTALLTTRITTDTNAPNTNVEIVLPESLQVLSGDTTWKGDLPAQQTVEFETVVKAVREGNFNIETKINGEYIEKKNINISDVQSLNITDVLNLPVPKWIKQRADSYIISFVGKEYFEENIELISSNTGWKEPFYGITYRYLAAQKNSTESPDFLYVIRISLNYKGDITEYLGPKKPYSFNITKEKALEIVREMGMKEPIKVNALYRSEIVTDNKTIKEIYVWNLEPDIFQVRLNSGDIEYIDMDVDTGTILNTKFYENTNPVTG